MIRKFLNFINGQTLVGELIRFVLVGGLATVIDYLAMAVTLFIAEPASTYPQFYNVFFGGGDPSVRSTLIGTGVGFLFGLLANYLLSIIFVFNEKGNSKSTSGFVKFTVLSLIGLGIHELGMFVLNGKLGWNEWLVKILLTVVVLIYNYITRRIFIFKNDEDAQKTSEEARQ
jgi:putative flippase GtrA